MTGEFVAFRVIVQPGELNRAALNRTLGVDQPDTAHGKIPFPLVLPTRDTKMIFTFPTMSSLPDYNLRSNNGDYVVKYESA